MAVNLHTHTRARAQKHLFVYLFTYVYIGGGRERESETERGLRNAFKVTGRNNLRVSSLHRSKVRFFI